VRAGVLAPEPMPVFVPVQITADAPSPDRLALPSPCSAPSKAVLAEAERIEIALPDGTCIRVGADVWLGGFAACDDGGAAVIAMPAGVRVWLANGPTDIAERFLLRGHPEISDQTRLL